MRKQTAIWSVVATLPIFALCGILSGIYPWSTTNPQATHQAFGETATAAYTRWLDCMGTLTNYECDLYRNAALGTRTPDATLVAAVTTLFAPVPVRMNTATEIPTSYPPSEAPQIVSPPDGAVLTTHFPDLRAASPARAWAVHYVITSEDGKFRLTYAVGTGGPLYGRLSDDYRAITPAPLPDGRYYWLAYGCRPTAVGGCGPQSETRSFVIDTQSTPN